MGSVMADSHITHNFFPLSSVSHFNTTTTINNNNNNAGPMAALAASSPPSSTPMISSGCQGQQYHNSKCQHHHHNHDLHNQAQTFYSSSSLRRGSATILTTSAALSAGEASDGTIGSMPPPNYFAMVVANKLLPDGPEMYGRKSDANCILRVGRRRYFVHVQMLASRSSSFLRIFNEMILNKAWGQDSASSTNGQDDDDYPDDDGDDGEGDDDLDLEYDDPASHDCFNPPSGVAVGGMGGQEALNVHASTTTTISTLATATTSTSASTSMSVTPLVPSSIREIGNDDDDDVDSFMIDEDEDHPHVFDLEDVVEYGDQEDEDEEDGQEEDDDTEDDGNYNEEGEKMPTLNLKLSRPVSSRFDEMLYWIYTNDSDRWRRCFTPANYSSILRNIALLHLVNPTVLAICRAFESDHQSFQGAAESFFVSRRLL